MQGGSSHMADNFRLKIWVEGEKTLPYRTMYNW